MQATPDPVLEQAGPLDGRQRMVSLDLLRGVAVLGILVMNIQSFAMPTPATMDPTRYGDYSGADFIIWLVSHLLFDGKFITIFAMLFGAGLLLTAERWEATGRRPWAIHSRRMAWLLAIGLVHAYLIWDGDILAMYALCGVLVFCFRWVSTGMLVGLGVALLAIPSMLNLTTALGLAHLPAEEVDWLHRYWSGEPGRVEAELEAFRGGWLEQMNARVPNALEMHSITLLFHAGPISAGMMLLGMAMYREGWLTGEAPASLYRTLLGLGSLVGVPVIAMGVVFQLQRDFDGYAYFVGGQFNHWMAPVVSLGWIGLVMLAFRHGVLARLQNALAAVGRMALTNYLAQSVICTFIFYGHGLGWFGHMERTGQVLVVLGVWLAQLLWSPMWLRRFRYGPVEWLWRWLTYGGRIRAE